MKIMIKHINPSVIALPALLCAALFTIGKSAVAKAGADEWIRIQRMTAVTCAPDGLYKARRESKKQEDNIPFNKSNGCAHQFGAGTLCSTNELKRRLLRYHPC